MSYIYTCIHTYIHLIHYSTQRKTALINCLFNRNRAKGRGGDGGHECERMRHTLTHSLTPRDGMMRSRGRETREGDVNGFIHKYNYILEGSGTPRAM